MYGVSPNLPLIRLVGQTVDSVSLCRYQVSFNFECQDYVCAMGSWELRDSTGRICDQENALYLEVEISLRNRQGILSKKSSAKKSPLTRSIHLYLLL